MGSEVAERVVAPVVAEAATQQRRFADELMNRHELHGGDAEGFEVLYGTSGCRMVKPRTCSS